MPFAENFHPEWGVLAPAPSVLRTMRIVLVATAIGATAGAGTVIALMDRPAAEASKLVQTAPTLAMPAIPSGMITPVATTPSASEAPAAAAALNELNSAAAAAPAPPAPDRIDVASRDGAAAAPQAPEPAVVRQPPAPAPAIAAVETGADKAVIADKTVVKKRHKAAHRKLRPWDSNAYGERRYDRGYNTAYRQW